ncbi:penicillin-binding transpeptidase domain-containing protein [Paenibacillus sp. PL91]|uniref:penicillin-binding transpeptidase domain-containing protein n=1 Tax=Paenibacillus sp. PL91 TaxID=2729538 RepID=UPI00145E9329|nr:penicillin-binding transpeptidase domain-containing protein [Paenibacillus sp. PL91]MBC9203753.1 penicillin-binding transpeptidase domain-containing protein [Paenibacillus sp. PL91]
MNLDNKIRVMCKGLLLFFVLLAGCTKHTSNPEDIADQYVQNWQQGHFEEMYDLLSASSRNGLTKEIFASRYKKIYEGIDTDILSITYLPVTDKNADKVEDRRAYSYEMKLDTSAGPINAEGRLQLEKEENGTWAVGWQPSLIFPSMQEGDTVSVTTLKASRGEIKDRNGNGLAINGLSEVIGIVPGKLGQNAENTKAKLAERLQIPVETIDRKLAASWVKDNLFVPIANISTAQEGGDYSDLPGVVSRTEDTRVYPYGEAVAHLTGYIREVTEEDLSTYPNSGYRAGDLIGKAGSEQVYEDVLRGKDGRSITIVNSDGRTKEVLAEEEPVDGRDVQLTIDVELQTSIYDSLSPDAGTAAAIQPTTGEILALVSSPSYDPNRFITGVSTEQWEEWNNDPDKPLLNRFTKLYAPGSVFKPITAAAGIELGVSSPDEVKEINGVRWSKDASWGGYYVKRVKDVPVLNLRDAHVYSDNIYLAQEALEMGADAFLEEAGKFIFADSLSIRYPFPKASLSNHGIKSEIQLADSGYGQGEVVMSPLHLALSYTPFVNAGKLTSPVLDFEEKSHAGSVSNSAVISANTASTVKNMLVDVVRDPAGSGHVAYMEGIELAGKTGTAELKSSKGEEGQENGWFITFDTEETKLLLAMMIEHVEGRGGSGYVVKKAVPVLKAYYGG